MKEFRSRKNHVRLITYRGREAVEKIFSASEGSAREMSIYRRLTGSVHVPHVLEEQPDRLILEYLPYPDLMQVLEEQDRAGFDSAPWEYLCGWIRRCYDSTDMLPGDCNLRNFLWDRNHLTVYGIDLEEYTGISVEECGARLAAHVRLADCEDRELKSIISGLIAEKTGADDKAVIDAEVRITEQRRMYRKKSITGVVLAGGKSSRMGRNKANMDFNGETLLECQVSKLKELGLENILIAGPKNLSVNGTITVPDKYTGMGPMAGLHAAMSEVKGEQCLVLSVDVPLISSQVLEELVAANTRSGSPITILEHNGLIEPLIGVYKTTLRWQIETLLENSKRSVRELLKIAGYDTFSYSGNEKLLINCNTEEDYNAALQTMLL